MNYKSPYLLQLFSELAEVQLAAYALIYSSIELKRLAQKEIYHLEIQTSELFLVERRYLYVEVFP